MLRNPHNVNVDHFEETTNLDTVHHKPHNEVKHHGSHYSIPALGEIVFVAKSTVSVLESLGRICIGDKNGAAVAIKRIPQEGNHYVEQSLIVAPINIGIRYLLGDKKGSENVAKEFTETFSSSMVELQPIPGVGEAATAFGVMVTYKNTRAQQRLMKEYSERNIIGGGINAATKACQGDQEEARRVASRMGTGFIGASLSVGGMFARTPTLGFSNPLSKSLQKTGAAFSAESTEKNPSWEHAGKEALVGGVNGMLTGTYFLASAGPRAENSIRHNWYGEEALDEQALQAQIEENYRLLAEDIVCARPEFKLHQKVEKVVFGSSHHVKQPLKQPVMPPQATMHGHLPIVSANDLGGSEPKSRKKKGWFN